MSRLCVLWWFLQYVFPGLWLASITPDSYRVNDGATKV